MKTGEQKNWRTTKSNFTDKKMKTGERRNWGTIKSPFLKISVTWYKEWSSDHNIAPTKMTFLTWILLPSSSFIYTRQPFRFTKTKGGQ